MEECAEIQKVAAKALRFGLDKRRTEQSLNNNAENLALEYADLCAVMQMLEENEPKAISLSVLPAHIQKKRQKVEEYLTYSQNCGTLTKNENTGELGELISQLSNNASDYFFHRNYDGGNLELNITFNDSDITQKFVDENKEKVRVIDACAYWE
jgi:hypothetical protein